MPTPRTIFILLLASGALASESAPRPAVVGEPPIGRTLDLTKHQLLQIELTVPEDRTSQYTRLVEHRLRFDGFDAEIPVSCSASMRSYGSVEPEQAGLDASTVKLSWLDPGRVISVTWDTFTLGQGRYSQEGHLVVLFDGEHFQELFRDVIYATGSSGMHDSSASTLHVSYDRDARVLTLTSNVRNRWSRNKEGPSDERGPFEREVHQHGKAVYLGDGTTRHVWKYRLEGERLEFLSGEQYVDLESQDRSVEAVAKAYRSSVETLRRLNPTLAPEGRIRGIVRIDDQLGPYSPEREDKLSGPPCP
jgi:hypothetical protein